MKIQCDVCERNPAMVFCCADEAALCAACDVEVHAANKLVSKHKRVHLQCVPNKRSTCDICQEKTAFIFCVEDRALFCQDCDESVHSVHTLAGKHQRYLATGIKLVAYCGSKCNKEAEKKNYTEPLYHQISEQITVKLPSQRSPSFSAPASWAVDDLLELSELKSANDDKKAGAVELGDQLEWWTDMALFGDEVQLPHEVSFTAAAEVPQLPVSQLPNTVIPQHRSSNMEYMPPNKKLRIESTEDDDDDDIFIVPDLG